MGLLIDQIVVALFLARRAYARPISDRLFFFPSPLTAGAGYDIDLLAMVPYKRRSLPKQIVKSLLYASGPFFLPFWCGLAKSDVADPHQHFSAAFLSGEERAYLFSSLSFWTGAA